VEETRPTFPKENLNGQERPTVNFSAWQFAWELGCTIAIPIVILALVGRFADRYFDSSPWLLLTGIVLSALLSSVLVYRKVKDVIQKY